MNTFVEIPASKSYLLRRKPVYGVGINDADYTVSCKIDGKQVFCPYYNVWKGMIQRSYDRKYQSLQPTYLGCSVSEEWHLFSVFKAWMIKQDWKGKALDKDVLSAGNKIYSEKFCVFVSSRVNNLLGSRKLSKLPLPQGVSQSTQKEKYIATCRSGGISVHLGIFSTIPMAEVAYLKFKSGVVISVAETQCKEVREGLLRHAKIMTDRIKLIS
tara:strand:- start:261 stop:899 length:639 start_codon:yes stop_codon:yes gene_type:complete